MSWRFGVPGRITFAGLLLGLTLLWPGCGGGETPTLHVYTWSDYIAPEAVSRFETEQGCRIVFDYFDSNESMYAKLKAGATGYDVIVPSSYMVRVMTEQGMLEALDPALLPNLANVDAAFRRLVAEPEMKHSVPYMVGTTGIGYLKSRVPDFKPSWSMFSRAELGRRMTLLNDMRETIGSALKHLGYSLNSTDESQLAQARDLIISWKGNIAKFESEQYKNGLVSGEFLVVQGYSGDIMQVMEENPDIAYAIPEEGTSVYVDELAVPAGAPEPVLAHAFINFLHDPEVAALNTEAVYFLCPNLPSYDLLSEAIRDNPAVVVPHSVLEKCEVVEDLGEGNAKYVQVWDQIKAAE